MSDEENTSPRGHNTRSRSRGSSHHSSEGPEPNDTGRDEDHSNFIEGVKNIRKEELVELLATVKPPTRAILLMEAVCILLGESNIDWFNAKRLLSNLPIFMKRLAGCSVKEIPKAKANYVKKMLSDREMNPQSLRKVTPALEALYYWVRGTIGQWEDFHGKIPPETRYESPELIKFRESLHASKSKEQFSFQRQSQEKDLSIVSTSLQKFKEILEFSDKQVEELKISHASQKVTEGLYIIIDGGKPDWFVINRFLGNPSLLFERIKALNPTKIPKDRVNRLRYCLADPSFDRNLISKASPTVQLGFEWLQTVLEINQSALVPVIEQPIPQEIEALRPKLIFISTSDLTEIKSFTNPAEKIKKVFQAVLMLLGESGDWNNVRKLISNPNKFLDTLKKLDFEALPNSYIDKANEILRDPDTKPHRVKPLSYPVGDLAQWVRDAIHFAESIKAWRATLPPPDFNNTLQTEEGHDVAHGNTILVNIEEEKRDDDHADKKGEPNGAKNQERSPTPALMKTEGVLKDSRLAIQSLDLLVLHELAGHEQPLEGVDKLFGVVAALLGKPEDWEHVKEMILANEFVGEVVKLEAEGLSESVVEKVRKELEDPEVQPDAVGKSSPAARDFAVWAKAIVDIWGFLKH